MRRIASLALLGLVLSAAPAAAAALPRPEAGLASTAGHPPFATYWDGFVEHWGGILKKQNGVIMVALAVGALSLFIITRGKWNKA